MHRHVRGHSRLCAGRVDRATERVRLTRARGKVELHVDGRNRRRAILYGDRGTRLKCDYFGYPPSVAGGAGVAADASFGAASFGAAAASFGADAVSLADPVSAF